MSNRTLVVDDVEFNRKLARTMLRVLGWESEEAVDGADALDKLKGAHGFQLVLLDISMPGIDGEEVCRILRSDSQYNSLPIVAYTAHALEEDRGRFLANGFDGLLIKPIEIKTLSAVIQQSIEKRRL